MNNDASTSNWTDPAPDADDAPELDDAWFASAEVRDGATVLRPRRGRPPGSSKRAVSLRLDAAVLAALRATGPGWQTRANDMLRKAVGL